jgi:hypothetical protein
MTEYVSWLNSPSGLCLLYQVPRSHPDTPHSVELLYTSEGYVAETSDNTQYLQDTDTYELAGIEPTIPANERP